MMNSRRVRCPASGETTVRSDEEAVAALRLRRLPDRYQRAEVQRVVRQQTRDVLAVFEGELLFVSVVGSFLIAFFDPAVCFLEAEVGPMRSSSLVVLQLAFFKAIHY